jgi:hypothetical protein
MMKQPIMMQIFRPNRSAEYGLFRGHRQQIFFGSRKSTDGSQNKQANNTTNVVHVVHDTKPVAVVLGMVKKLLPQVKLLGCVE